jgi:ABC-type uncharacterized transport system substrate-binding protein
LALLTGSPLGWPLLATAQTSLPVVGVLGSGTPSSQSSAVAALQQGLKDSGFDAGRNVSLEFRWSEGQYQRMATIADEFVRAKVKVIVTLGGTPTVRAAKAATSTIPIVFLVGLDPVAAGLVTSMNRPGGNATGITTLTVGLAAKRLETVRELVPGLRKLAVLVNSNNPTASPNIKEAKAAAGVVGIEVHVANVQTDSDFEPAFQAMARDQVGALLVGGDQFHLSRREKITALAARFRIPAAYYSREYIAAGGLICYGTDINDAYRQVGRYAGRILDGVKPADLPVQQAAKFELVLNLKTARALNLEVPPILLARADEVIE